MLCYSNNLVERMPSPRDSEIGTVSLSPA